MPIVIHFGPSIKAYRELCRRWTPAACLAGDGDGVRLHDTYPPGTAPGQQEPIRILRFRGRRCGCVVSVLPDLLLPGCSYPAEVRDRAYAAIADGSVRARMRALGRLDVLVMDELGFLALDTTASNDFFQVVAQAYLQRSLIVTSNRPYQECGRSSPRRPSPRRCWTACCTT